MIPSSLEKIKKTAFLEKWEAPSPSQPVSGVLQWTVGGQPLPLPHLLCQEWGLQPLGREKNFALGTTSGQLESSLRKCPF